MENTVTLYYCPKCNTLLETVKGLHDEAKANCIYGPDLEEEECYIIDSREAESFWCTKCNGYLGIYLDYFTVTIDDTGKITSISGEIDTEETRSNIKKQIDINRIKKLVFRR